MKAIVCDSCGKAVLIPDELSGRHQEGIYHLEGYSNGRIYVDLCQECFDKLMAAVRRENDDD